MSFLSQVDSTDEGFIQKESAHFFGKLPKNIKGIITAVSLGIVSGCSTLGENRSNTTDQNLSRTPNGEMMYTPPKHTDIQNASPGSVDHSIIGAGVGFIVCKVLGSSPSTRFGCAIIGGLIGSQNYNQTEIEQQDFQQLERQLIRAYQVGPSNENKITDSNTRYVAVIRKGMIGKIYHIRFKIQEVNNSGRIVRSYFAHASLKSGVQGYGQALQMINPLPFSDESAFPIR